MASPPVLSIQLYSLRNEGSLVTQLDLAQAAGFTAVETIERLMEDAERTRAELDARGLEAVSGHVSFQAMRERAQWVVTAARSLGIRTLVVPALPQPVRPTDAQGWRAIGTELGQMAHRLAGEGLALAFHNHAWEVEPLPDATLPLDLLLEAGAPGGLGWQADLAWLVRGGADPLALVDRHAGRLTSVHVKDIAPDGEAQDEDGWADVGHGTMDWPTLWARCVDAGAGLMIAEHDLPSDAARFARRSFAAMHDLVAGPGR